MVDEPKRREQNLTYEKALEGTISFSERYVERSAYRFFPEPEVVEVVQQGLAVNQVEYGYRYCP